MCAGMPAWYFYLLYSHKEDIKNRHESLPTPQQEEERSLRTRPLRLLYDFYSPEFWYWEVVETLLRLSVTGEREIERGGKDTLICSCINYVMCCLSHSLKVFLFSLAPDPLCRPQWGCCLL